ncbi:MAG: cell division protein ZapE [Steroidobacteraceae bacterium]
MSESRSVAARLARDVAAHRLEFDAGQHSAAVRLDDLALALNRSRRGGRWRRMRLKWLPRSAVIAPLRGVYLWGEVGRGKTHLMDLFYESLDFEERERSHFYRFMRAVHAGLAGVQRRSEPLENVAQNLARRARVICLDEFFVSDIADAMILAGLFEGLFRRGVTLVATSNSPPRELYKDGLQRQRFLPAIELLESRLDVVRLDGGPDYRLRQLERARTYLDSTAPDTVAELRRLFGALAGGSATPAVQINIEGRPIRTLGAGAGLAWFEFRELCEGPRSQNDYIEIAHLYQTIFVSDVPVFRREHEDAARRFVMLIDELYDRGVNLVVSAAAEPAQLYRGERLRFEFQRTASRLMEMQSHLYLARGHRP